MSHRVALRRSAPGLIKSWIATVAGMACLLAVLALSGCEGVSFIAQAFDDKVKPEFEPDEDKPLLVLVDDSTLALDDPSLPTFVAALIGQQLVQEKAVKTVIPPEKIAAYAQQRADNFRRTPIDQVGRDLGAEQVIYVNLIKAGLNMEPGVVRPDATAKVRLIDAKTGQRLFPLNIPDGRTVNVAIKARPATGENMRGESTVIRRELAQRLARDVARLFHKYKPRQPGEPFED